jgi:hypothetical protein
VFEKKNVYLQPQNVIIQNVIIMCTYNISVDDALMERVRPAFADNAAIGRWMQAQIETLLLQMAADTKQGRMQKSLSGRLRGIASHAPKDFDYKKELEKRF